MAISPMGERVRHWPDGLGTAIGGTMQGGTFDTPRDWAIDLGACVAIGIFLALLGPFGSWLNDTAPARIVYWTTMSVLSGAVFGVLLRWLRPYAARAGLPVWTWLPAAVVVGSIPLSTVSRLVAVSIWPFLENVGMFDWYCQGALVSLGTIFPYALLRAHLAGKPPIAAPRDNPSALNRVPERLRHDLLCLQMEDHYVRVHTAQRSELVLQSLSRAIAELDGIDGMQVHRSWWVARHAVSANIADGRNLRLKLVNGLDVPVARASIAKLREAGWLG